MKSIIVVSICEKSLGLLDGSCLFEFHFKGYLSGNKINKISVHSSISKSITVGEEYILYLEIIKIDKMVLHTKLLKLKELKSICYVY